MKVLIIVLLIALCAGISGGYYYGHNFLALGVAKTIDDNIVMEGSFPYNTLQLSYYCNNEKLAAYNIVDDTLVTALSDDKELFKREIEGKKDAESQNFVGDIRKYTVGFFLGGGFTRFSRPIITAIKSDENKRYTIPGVMGAVSGFYFGYMIATRSLPACNSFEALLMVRDIDFWKTIRRVYASTMWLKAQSAALLAGDEDVVKKLDSMHASINSNHISIEDFAYLGIRTGELSNPQGTKTPLLKTNENTKSWLDYTLLIIIPICLSISLAILIFLVLTKQMREKRERGLKRAAARSARGAAPPAAGG